MKLKSVHGDMKKVAPGFPPRMYETEKGTGYMAVVVPEGPHDRQPVEHALLRQGDRFWSVQAVERPHSSVELLDIHLLLRPWEKSGTVGMPDVGLILVTSGCCVDRPYGTGCTDENCMNLPPGKSCNGCVHVERCVSIFGQKAEARYCQWFPRRFHENTDG